MDPVSTVLPLIFKAPGAIQGAAAMIGLIESLDKKLDRLISADFDAGIRCLNEISNTTKEHDFLLKQGWNRFHSALSNEVGERKALAYIGLAFCQFYLGESKLAVNTLYELQEYDYVDKGTRLRRNIFLGALATATQPLLFSFVLPGIIVLLASRSLNKEKLSSDQFKNVTDFLKDSKWFQIWSHIPSEEKVSVLKKSAKEIIDVIQAE